jgi:predicted nucleotidyltransferase/uncharacterized protein (UPF0332 family)
MSAVLPKIKADPVLKRFTCEVERLFPGRLEQVILYGSRARGEARPDSDYDIAVVLHDAAPDRHDDRVDHLVLDLYREFGAEVNAWIFSAPDLAERTLFSHNLRKDGIDLRRWRAADFPPIRESREEYVKAITASLLSFARESLGNATGTARMAMPALAAREAYMAGFNAARALIFERTGKSPKTHNGVNALFNDIARSTPEMTRDLVSFIGEGYRFKAWADYHEGVPTRPDEARHASDAATRLIGSIERLLAEKS